MIAMPETREKKAHLLIENYENIDGFNKRITDSQYEATDVDTPTLRFRGTLVDARNGLENLKITCWQRNVSRLRKMDVSLPAIVTISLNARQRIEEVELDRSFKGSKGLMCCHSYLNGNLKSKLRGHPLDATFIHEVKQEKTHCAHLFEVLSGMYSYYRILKEDGFAALDPQRYAWEEESIDSFTENGTIHSVGVHVLKGRAPIHYGLILHDIMGKVRFEKNGLFRVGDVEADFFIHGKNAVHGTVSLHGGSAGSTDLARFLFGCIEELKPELCPGKDIRLFNTNLYPRACIGLLIQVAAVRLFNSNYSYVMHALTALQRSNDAPLCVGALRDQGEADRFFPGFSFRELI
jgi:hypothetical protein